MSRGIVGRFFKNDVYMRDSRHAANNFGYNKSALNNGTPRHKFQYFVNFRFNSTDTVKNFVEYFLPDQDFVTALVKSVTMPNVSIDTEVLNQYNRRKIIQTKLKPSPVTLMLHDTVEGKTLRFWEMYYEYYFKDGIATEKTRPDSSQVNNALFKHDLLNETFSNQFGYNLERVGNNKQLIDSIEIFQVHGGKYSLTTLVNPRITTFTHDTLDYAETSGLMQITMELEYEAVVYSNVNEPLRSFGEDVLERYRDGDYWQMANLITISNDVKGRDLKSKDQKYPPKPEVPVVSPEVTSTGTSTGAGDDSAGNSSPTPQTSGLQNFVNLNVARVQEARDAIVESIPGAISSAVSSSIFGGKISFSPSPKKVLKSTFNSIARDAVFRGQEALSARVTQTVQSVIDNVSDQDQPLELDPTQPITLPDVGDQIA